MHFILCLFLVFFGTETLFFMKENGKITDFKLSYRIDGELVQVDLDNPAFEKCYTCMHNLFEQQLLLIKHDETKRVIKHLRMLQEQKQLTELQLFIRRNKHHMPAISALEYETAA